MTTAPCWKLEKNQTSVSGFEGLHLFMDYQKREVKMWLP